jgi:hypothetical protein
LDLFSTLQAVQQGSQMGDAASQGIVPNATQPKGSPQLYIKAIGMIRSKVAELNTIMDGMFREAGTDDTIHKAVKEVMDCIQKLQGVSITLETHLKELQATQAQNAGAAPQPSQPQAM